MDDSFAGALDQLAACQTPLLIGVRHHSAALARSIPALLDAFQPDAVLLEMPPDFLAWLPYLGRADLQAPVALAACHQGQLLSFYPLADFSPELAAVRWAAARGVPVIPIDLGLAAMTSLEGRPNLERESDDEQPLVQRLLDQYEARNTADLWERLVETPASGADAESVRRAALYFGWTLRHSSHGPTRVDAYREAAMRAAVRQAPARAAAVIGSFHAAALLPEPLLWTPPTEPLESLETSEAAALTTSLIPYSFGQLDLRSGYPAGVLDPSWQQLALTVTTPAAARLVLTDLAIALCRRLRDAGHVAGTPDASEVVRVATDLSRLRRLPAPGRGELLEAIQTVLVQGDLLGKGRAVAAAAQAVLVGNRRGQLPADAPRSGLSLDVESTVARLRLPGPASADEPARELRLDPLRSPLDRARAVVLRRLELANVRYAERIDTQSTGPRENLTELWSVRWTNGTAATLEAAGTHGVTLVQVCEAALRRLGHLDAQQAGQSGADEANPATVLRRFAAAAECGLTGTARELLGTLHQDFRQRASATELITTAAWLERIRMGHVLGLPLVEADAVEPDIRCFAAPREWLDSYPFVEAALRGFEGLAGSDQPSDVVALADLTAMIAAAVAESAANADGASSLAALLPALRSRLVKLRRTGSSRMQGAAWGALAMLSVVDAVALGATLGSWYDNASNHDGRTALRSRLLGLLVPLLPHVATDPVWLDGLNERFAHATDESFLERLPALRAGFQGVAPADRARLLHDRLALLPASSSARRTVAAEDPRGFASATAADRAGREAIARLLPDLVLADHSGAGVPPTVQRLSEPPGQISLGERWRLVLGVQGCQSQRARRAAATLDQLYGASISPGRSRQADLAGGGTEEAAPGVREWIAEADGLFGKDVCEEVMAEAATGGRAAVLEHFDPQSTRPSLELLEQILSLKGALPERDLARLRKLARRITEQLAARLANRLRAALTGLSTARPSRRRSRWIDFAETIEANLETARRRPDGRIALAPRRVIFRTPARRHMDWHLIFVVDVSGSMEASVIYSALMAGIFSQLPALDVRFFAFSTAVLDLSQRVDDPLALLMEVQVGGGTHIGLGLRAAREAIKNPSRTLVVLITDFEEGVSVAEMLAEVKQLSDSGAKLIGLAALDDQATPRYHVGNAAAVVAAGMPVAAVSPERLAEWVGDRLRGKHA